MTFSLRKNILSLAIYLCTLRNVSTDTTLVSNVELVPRISTRKNKKSGGCFQKNLSVLAIAWWKRGLCLYACSLSILLSSAQFKDSLD